MTNQDKWPAPALHSLLVDNLQLLIRLGCLEEERQTPQEVRVSLELRFIDSPPAGFYTDHLSGTLCYAELCQTISQQVQQKTYHLIEKIAADIYSIAKVFAKGQALVALKVHKVHPPVPNLHGGTSYHCGDF